MASPIGKAVDDLPKHLKDAVIGHLIANKPLRAIADICGLSHMTLKRYRDEKILPTLGALPQFGYIKPLPDVTTQATENKAVIQSSVDKVVTESYKANLVGEVQAQVIALRERAKNVLTRVESRPDDQFSGREWASVATVAARMMETQGRMTGELADSKGAGDVNIQINMAASGRAKDQETIDVDVIKR